MSNAAEAASTNKYSAHSLYEIAYRINVCGEIRHGRHGTCGGEQTGKQQEYDHEEPHYEDGLLHGVGVIGYNQSERREE